MVRFGVLLVPVALVLTPAAPARQPARGPAGKTASPAASFAARPAGGREYRVLPEKADVYPGDLLVGMPGATVVSANGGVTLKSLADLDGRSPLPVLEAAVSLNDPAGADLDFTLDRGRVDVTNTKPKGPATVVARFWGQAWKITLDGRDSRVALEVCGRWRPGTKFRPVSKDEVNPPAPDASVILLVLGGTASVDLGGKSFGLTAPPGPALLEWDSAAGTRPQPLKLDAPPPWADPAANLSPAGQKKAAAVERFRKARDANPDAALDTFLASADPVDQRIVLVSLGATDDLDRLMDAVAGEKAPAEWDFAVTVLRHWLGRCPRQEQKLYDHLRASRGFTPAQARTLVQLLFGFAPADLKRPETFEVLAEYLRHERPAIRDLAEWHLVRLVPGGKDIPFSPSGGKDEQEKTYQAWKKLIPAGTVPGGAKKP
jgi:hypothetical protein